MFRNLTCLLVMGVLPLAAQELEERHSTLIVGEITEMEAIPLNEVLEASGSKTPIRAATAGSWGDSVSVPNLYNTGLWYYGQSMYPVGVPSGATNNYITYSWGTSYNPGLLVYLCTDDGSGAGHCYNVSGAGWGGGSISSPANWYWFFAFAVPGNGSALNPPINGYSSTINVTWQQ